jgi:two-component system LytT family response regulator
MSGEKMKVIIVEDEFLAQQELTWLINTHSQMEIVGTFDDGLDVLKFQHNKVDAIFSISIFRRWTGLLAQNISQFAHKPLSFLSPRGKSTRWKPLSWRRLTTS